MAPTWGTAPQGRGCDMQSLSTVSPRATEGGLDGDLGVEKGGGEERASPLRRRGFWVQHQVGCKGTPGAG